MMVRTPAVAGSFYPDSAPECRRVLDRCFNQASSPSAAGGRIVGGVVPHAGWMCSGSLAASVFAALAARRTPATVVVFGAVHVRGVKEASVFAAGLWDTPMGRVAIDGRLAERVMGHTHMISADPFVHEAEHSIEVQVPFIQRVWPDAKLLPIMVTPCERAVAIGESVGETLKSYGYDAVVLASSDLTHYGDTYGFTPMGNGAKGLDWAKQVNDRRIIDRMLALDADGIVPEATAHRNACGSGAIAAAISASRVLGATRATLVAHATSRETLSMYDHDAAVGYAGWFFKPMLTHDSHSCC